MTAGKRRSLVANGIIRSYEKSGLDVIIKWSSVGDVENQRSGVNAKVYVRHRDVYCAALSGSYLKVGDTVYPFSASLSSSDSSIKDTLVYEKDFTVNHTPDGKAQISLSACYVFNGTYAGCSVTSIVASGTAVLDTLLSKSAFSAPGVLVLGEKANVKIATDGGDKKYKVSLCVGSETYITGFLSGKSLEFTVPKTMAYGMTDERRKSGTLTLESFTQSGVSLGTVSQNVTFEVPQTSDFKPTFNLSTEALSSSNYLVQKGLLAVGMSKVRISISESAVKYGTSVASYEIRAYGKKYSVYTVDCDVLIEGDSVITARVFDKRGNYTEKSVAVSAYAYRAPYYTVAKAYRCNADGEKTDGGTSLYIEGAVSLSELDGLNTAVISVSVRERDGEQVGSYTLTNGQNKTVCPPLSASKSYTVEFSCRDSVGKLAKTAFSLPTEKVDLHIIDGALKLGGIVEKPGFDCVWDADFGGDLYIKGEKITDYVIESGSDGPWMWRKWKSGFAECFGMVDKRYYDVSVEYGDGYKSVVGNEYNNSVSYPSGLFFSRPVVTVNTFSIDRPVTCKVSDHGSNIATPRYTICADYSGQYEVEIFIHAVGKSGTNLV